MELGDYVWVVGKTREKILAENASYPLVPDLHYPVDKPGQIVMISQTQTRAVIRWGIEGKDLNWSVRFDDLVKDFCGECGGLAGVGDYLCESCRG